MSRRKRSLSSFSLVVASHSRQLSGLISSASTMRMKSFSHSRPNSSLKSTSLMPAPRNRPDRKSLTRMVGVSPVVQGFGVGPARRGRGGCSVGRVLGAGPAEGGDMLFADPGIVQPVILVVIFDNRTGQGGAFLDPQPLGHGTGGDIAHHHFQGNDLDFLDQLLAHVEAAHEMGGHADGGQLGHQIFADAVVEDALALDGVLLGAIAGGGVILEILDDSAWLGALVKNLGFAFVD